LSEVLCLKEHRYSRGTQRGVELRGLNTALKLVDIGDDDTAANERATTIERDMMILPRFGALVRR
jgi:hypothetical protein